MKSFTRIAFFAALLLVGPGVAGWADTTATHFAVKGDTAIAQFQATSPTDACIEFFVSVVASDQMQKISPGGEPTSMVGTVLVVAALDVCQSITLLSGGGEASDQAFRLAGDLSAATLSTTIRVLDTVSFQIITFDVNLTWTATGEPVFEQTKEMFRDRDLGLLIVTQIRGWHAPAVATGTVVGLGRNFTPEPSTSAELEKVNDGTIVIEMTR